MKNQLVRVALLAALLGATAMAQALSEQLQKGIYTQETLGDLEGAVRIFRQVVSAAPPDSDIRVQAQLRLRAAEELRAARERHRRVSEKYATFDGRTYRHKLTGLTFDVPAGWTVEGTGPSSDNGEMVRLSSKMPEASINVWLIPEKNNAASIEEKLNRSPVAKWKSREGLLGYRLRDGSVQRVMINGERAMVATADYGNEQEPNVEYMTWIYTENTHTFFFAHVGAAQADLLKPQFDALVHSAIVP
jgi:hypothetical protein